MKCNLKELALLSDSPCVIEGRLNYKKTNSGAIREGVFKERWFRLVKNYLFYFRLSEMGKFDARCPAGVFIMENSTIQMEHGQTIPFTFSISFLEETEKRHILAARTQEVVARWLCALRQCSYEYLRSELYTLQAKIFAISGYDPLLLVPRNVGAKLWAPSVPFSTAPACTSSAAGFSCHLHSKGNTPPTFTLDRSHSDALLAHKHRLDLTSHSHTNSSHIHKHTTHKNTHSKIEKDEGLLISLSPTRAEQSESKTKEVNQMKSGFSLEKSLTTTIMSNEFTNSIFHSEVLYTRPAPSPPERKRSPRPQKINLSHGDSLAELSRSLATTSILDAGPSAPPRRKISPREMSGPADTPVTSNSYTEDLIKF